MTEVNTDNAMVDIHLLGLAFEYSLDLDPSSHVSEAAVGMLPQVKNEYKLLFCDCSYIEEVLGQMQSMEEGMICGVSGSLCSPDFMFWSTTSNTVSRASGERLWLITGSSVYSFSWSGCCSHNTKVYKTSPQCTRHVGQSSYSKQGF